MVQCWVTKELLWLLESDPTVSFWLEMFFSVYDCTSWLWRPHSSSENQDLAVTTFWNLYVYIYIHIHTCVCIYIYICLMYIYIYINLKISLYIHVFFIHMDMYFFMCCHISLCICICVCFIYIYIWDDMFDVTIYFLYVIVIFFFPNIIIYYRDHSYQKENI